MAAKHYDEQTRQVLRVMATGTRDREVAATVHVSLRTVQRIVNNFMTDTATHSRFAAGAAAYRLGLLENPRV